MTDQDITDLIRAVVEHQRHLFESQLQMDDCTLRFAGGTRLRVSRTKVKMRGPDDKKWLDVSNDFPVPA